MTRKASTYKGDTQKLEIFRNITQINPDNALVNPYSDLYCLFLDEPQATMKGCFFCFKGTCYLKQQSSCPRTHDPDMNPKLRLAHPPLISSPNVYTWEGIEL